jgi:uncharacterized protein YecE (DUF72 family)
MQRVRVPQPRLVRSRDLRAARPLRRLILRPRHAGSKTERITVGPVAYVRFHGGEGKYWGRYADEALLGWTDWILEQSRQGRAVWSYFNNDIHGHAIHDAQTLKSMVGQMRR